MSKTPFKHAGEVANPKAIEEYVYNFLNTLPKSPMTQEQSKMFISISLIDDKGAAALVNQIRADANGKAMLFLFDIMTNRMATLPIELDVRSRAWLTLTGICETPGEVVIYLAYLTCWAAEKGKKVVTFDDLVYGPFAMGIFTRESLTMAWDNQKVSPPTAGNSDNLLDYSSAYASVLNKFKTQNV